MSLARFGRSYLRFSTPAVASLWCSWNNGLYACHVYVFFGQCPKHMASWPKGLWIIIYVWQCISSYYFHSIPLRERTFHSSRFHSLHALLILCKDEVCIVQNRVRTQLKKDTCNSTYFSKINFRFTLEIYNGTWSLIISLLNIHVSLCLTMRLSRSLPSIFTHPSLMWSILLFFILSSVVIIYPLRLYFSISLQSLIR